MVPVFEVFRRYSGEDAVPILAQETSRWGYYAPLALAQMNNESSISTLMEMGNKLIESKTGGNSFAISALAEVAHNDQEATKLIAHAAATGVFKEAQWVGIAQSLSGIIHEFSEPYLEDAQARAEALNVTQTHIASGNQNLFARRDPAMTVEEIQQRTQNIEAIASVAANQSVAQLLNREAEELKNLLAKRKRN